jgi:hypothetical protein
VGHAVNRTDDAGGVSPLVQFIVNSPGLAEALIAEHIDDGRGYCRACALGAQRGYHQHPCNIRCAAERVRQIKRN